MSNEDPIAFFLTWVTYGTWLPGDARGWVEYKRGWQLPSPHLEAECESKMSSDACRLTKTQREAVEAQVAETCGYRGWHLHTVNCRSNHIHVVVTANETAPKKVRIDLKAYATRCLKKLDETRDDWWAERGSIRWIYNDDDLESAIIYVIDGQDRKPNA
jgi:REP element-mobilizing transposase RayT